MNIKNKLNNYFSLALVELGVTEDFNVNLQEATQERFGDYQSNAALVLAKRLKKNPRQIATELVAKLEAQSPHFTYEIAGPGFINVKLTSDFIHNTLYEVGQGGTLGVEPRDKIQTIVVDYSHPNLAKEMHVGHLRSTIIGDAMVKTLEFLGHQVIRHNHMGDWGTQFGMLTAYLEKYTKDEGAELADLEHFYRSAKVLLESDPDFAQLASEYTVKLQSGDERCLALWRRFTTISIQHCDKIYRKLDVSLRPEHVRGESAYNDELPVIIKDLDKQGLLVVSDGAKCVFLDEFKTNKGDIIPVIVQKSDGGYLYATTDLAAARYRSQALKADRLLYVVDSRQSLHLEQVFTVSRKAGFVPESSQLEHLPFGTMMGKDGKPFKTRDGGTVKLYELLEEAEARAYKLLAERNSDLNEDEMRHIAHAVGIGAVKYADLSKTRTSDYIFNWETMLSFEGNTAPYIQYAYTRIRSLFSKAETEFEFLVENSEALLLDEAAERSLAMKLLRFPEVINAVEQQGYPHILCSYLYELSKNFMSFYESCPIMTSGDALKKSRLTLSYCTAHTLKTGLSLLGIQVMKRM